MRLSLLLAITFLAIGIGLRWWIYDGVEVVGDADNAIEATGRALVLFGFGIGFTVLSTMSLFVSFASFVIFLLIGLYKGARLVATRLKTRREKV